MQTLRTGGRTLVWLVVVLLLFIGISYTVAPDAPEEFPDFVSDSPSPTGVKAFYTYMDNQTGTVNRWDHSPELLTGEDDNQLLIMVEPSFTPNTKEMEEYISFMESGNTILLLKTNPDGMFGIETVPAQSESGTVTNQNGNDHKADLNSTFRIDSNKDSNIVLRDDAGVIAAERDLGIGKLITAVSPEWITNGKILEQDHLELIFYLIQTGNERWEAIYFDEYLHESEHAPAITTLYPGWMLVLGFQVILLTIVWLMHQGKRFGPVIEPREETVRFSYERIRALAAWYQRGNRYIDSLRIQADYLKLRLQERWGIPYYKDWSDIKEHIERKMDTEQDMDTFFNGLTYVLRQDRISKKTYLSWAKQIDRLRKEVEEG
ncbi:DUF4350 domain-containing protein [Virgibacillus doumboii]|uniref:DUF4350 domain-containing protein n=1 Tax=Virgibacillus doumboii TaxID=2697503 RepID=UPI0013DF6BFC|nr:DUF4350 domain-containing protein [Virgibacillus doumboii]